MKNYVKPSINVIELQLKENIAAVPTTVYKGSTKTAASSASFKRSLALTTANSGVDGTYDSSTM